MLLKALWFYSGIMGKKGHLTFGGGCIRIPRTASGTPLLSAIKFKTLVITRLLGNPRLLLGERLLIIQKFITSWTSIFNEATFREILLPSSADDGRSISQKRSLVKHTCSWHDKLVIEVILLKYSCVQDHNLRMVCLCCFAVEMYHVT